MAAWFLKPHLGQMESRLCQSPVRGPLSQLEVTGCMHPGRGHMVSRPPLVTGVSTWRPQPGCSCQSLRSLFGQQ